MYIFSDILYHYKTYESQNDSTAFLEKCVPPKVNGSINIMHCLWFYKAVLSTLIFRENIIGLWGSHYNFFFFLENLNSVGHFVV